MSAMTGWWSRRSVAGKVELYTRWTFHCMPPVELVALGGVPLSSAGRGGMGTGAAIGTALWVLVHSALCWVVASRALDHTSGIRPRPVRLAAVLAAATALADLTVAGLWAAGILPDGSVNASILVATSIFTAGTLALCLDRVRHMAYAVAGTALAAALPLAAFGHGVPESLITLAAVLVAGGGYAAACGFSSWLLGVVQELERSRDLKARLAVAEERLRFGRDLHDVMGRNLSVIALKSELAVQLARRGRPEGIDQMVEVQRIAQESQREVREVVRGYREADLRVELEGARGVLDAAGIDCSVDAPALDLPAAVQSALGWVVRETTTNVLRHGDARRCAIALRRTPDAVVLTVENDGAVVPAGAAVPGRTGSGLAGLRERITAVGGTLEAGFTDPQSFRATARVPLTGPEGTGTPHEKETVA
ncbi:sensor histidine kinase [Streptomyces omiyaensis]|uniref:Sensor histidine kinase n=1 Tax=Streptomyces omiyaensis TaxID=68247 RepID=A0ABW7C3I8_9ACTN|nr:histidine kinase [Streptomyces omiyaensis]GGY72069.1 histidine kinase [Streptomyces omiyaensis]